MKKLKKILRIMVWVFVILLACSGLGIAGGIGLLNHQHRKTQKQLFTTEQVEEYHEEVGFENEDLA